MTILLQKRAAVIVALFVQWFYPTCSLSLVLACKTGSMHLFRLALNPVLLCEQSLRRRF